MGPQENIFYKDLGNIKKHIKIKVPDIRKYYWYTQVIWPKRKHMWIKGISRSILKPKIWMLITFIWELEKHHKNVLKPNINILRTTPSIDRWWDNLGKHISKKKSIISKYQKSYQKVTGCHWEYYFKIKYLDIYHAF